jgi:transcription factor TFIIIB component B''
MAALCDDTGWGRVSSKAAQIVDNHLAWKKTIREKRARMRVSMEAKKYGRNEDDTAQPSQSSSAPEQSITTNEHATPAEPSSAPMNRGVRENTDGDPSGSGFDYSQNVATSRYNVQIRIGPNGETIIDEESLFVDRNATDETADYTHVEESDVTKFVNSGTYGKRFRGSRWSAEETELFFDVSVDSV